MKFSRWMLVGAICTTIMAEDMPPELSPIGVFNLDDRLAALDGTSAPMYFELAEEVAAEIQDERGLSLARSLFVHAFEISRDDSGVSPLTESVCLALAGLEHENSERRRWLMGIASLERDSMVIERDASRSIPEENQRLATAFAYYFAEEYLKARAQVNRARVRRLVSTLEGKDAEIVGDVLREIEHGTACEVCRNRRVVPGRSGGADVLCPRCQGNPGPRLSDGEYRDLLLFQIDLLRVEPLNWSAQLDLDGGAPLRDASPDQLPKMFGVDPNANIYRFDSERGWRAGRWISPDSDTDTGSQE